MASIVWMAIFALLLLELGVVLILVVPVPTKIRNLIAREVFALNLGEKLRKPIMYLALALSLALMESFFTHQRIINRIYDEQEAGVTDGAGSDRRHHHHGDRFYPNLHDKERKYKSERNLYLAGFALTLLFAIGRLTTLLQESVELHDEAERLKKNTAKSSSSEPSATTESKKDT